MLSDSKHQTRFAIRSYPVFAADHNWLSTKPRPLKNKGLPNFERPWTKPTIFQSFRLHFRCVVIYTTSANFLMSKGYNLLVPLFFLGPDFSSTIAVPLKMFLVQVAVVCLRLPEHLTTYVALKTKSKSINVLMIDFKRCCSKIVSKKDPRSLLS